MCLCDGFEGCYSHWRGRKFGRILEWVNKILISFMSSFVITISSTLPSHSSSSFLPFLPSHISKVSILLSSLCRRTCVHRPTSKVYPFIFLFLPHRSCLYFCFILHKVNLTALHSKSSLRNGFRSFWSCAGSATTFIHPDKKK